MHKLTVGFVLAFAAAAGCSQNEQVPPTAANTTTTYGMENDTAVTKIAKARCNREITCNDVGKGKQFDSFETCVRQVNRDATETLHANACGHGVDDAQLSACLSDIQTQACVNPLERVDRIGSCATTSLCI
jgi:hypothetical protein